jgi:hypothetical protein
MAQNRATTDSGAAPHKQPKTAFLTPWEHMSKYQATIRNGPPKPSAAALARAEERARFEKALFAATLLSTNAQLADPIRARYEYGNAMDVGGGVAWPCYHCSLSVETAYVAAAGQCELCHMDLCSACQRAHASSCRCGAPNVVAPKAPATPDDSTVDSSDGINADGADSDSDISVE